LREPEAVAHGLPERAEEGVLPDGADHARAFAHVWPERRDAMKLALVLLLAAATVPGAKGRFRWRSAPPTEGVPRAPRPASTPALASEGARIYQSRCAACHGPEGHGDGILASRMRTPPRDFTLAVYKVRSTPSGSLPTDMDLFQTISRGMHGTDMAPWSRFEERERWAVVDHLKSLSPRFQMEGGQAPVEVPRPPAESRASLRKRGGALYWQLQCNNCHGPSGRGDGPGAREFVSEGKRVRIRDLGRADFVRGDAARDIFLTLRTGLDGSPMGAYELPSEDLWSLAYYVREVLRRSAPTQSLADDEAEDRGASH
jgi:mono/diheme cytochrome c family protein